MLQFHFNYDLKYNTLSSQWLRGCRSQWKTTLLIMTYSLRATHCGLYLSSTHTTGNRLNSTTRHAAYLSMRESLMEVAMALGCVSLSLKTLSMTDNSVLVVSSPQNAHQSFTTIPAAMTSLPRFTVPACGTKITLEQYLLNVQTGTLKVYWDFLTQKCSAVVSEAE